MATMRQLLFGLEMNRVDAPNVLARVVDIMSVRNRTYSELVDNAGNAKHPTALATFPDDCSSIDMRRTPPPAPVRFDDLGPKALFQGNDLAGHRTHATPVSPAHDVVWATVSKRHEVYGSCDG